MKAKRRVVSKDVALQSQLETETRQREHQVTDIVEPAAPDWARWQVLEWSVSISTWQHYGFARSEADRTRLADAIRALGGKVKYERVEPSREQRSNGGASVSGPSGLAEPPKGYPSSPAYRRALRSSVMHWLTELGNVRSEAHLPLEQLREMRAACKAALQKHGDRFISAVQRDPLRPWGD